MTLRSRLLSLAVASMLSAGASLTALPAFPASAVDTGATVATSQDCVVAYQLAAEWSGGFYGLVTLTNVGAAASTGWEVTLDFPNGQVVRPPWDPIGIPPQPGDPPNRLRIRNTTWNAVIAPNGAVTFGILGTHTGLNHPPSTGCVLFL